MAKPTHNYATLSAPGTKKISVCARRVGSRERMSVIAVCTDETSAEKIVDGLNMLQGETTKLEVPVQRVLEDVRAALAREIAVGKAQSDKIRGLEQTIHIKDREFADYQRKTQDEYSKLRAELNGLREQKAPLEKA